MESNKNIDLCNHEVINDGTFKEGLCYIKNYDGVFKGDYEDPADAMNPEATLAAEEIPMWPTKYQAFLIHKDDTIDIVCYHSVNYSTYLREMAFEIWMTARDRKMMVPKEKWLEYPNGNLIAVNSPRAMYHQMIADMLRFDSIDISQFGELKPRENQILTI